MAISFSKLPRINKMESSLAAEPCNGSISIFHFIPYSIFPNDSDQQPGLLTGNKDNPIRFWIHIGLVAFGLLIAIVSLIVNSCKPLPHGKLSDGDGSCVVPVRASFIVAHLIPGFVIFTVTYFTGLNFDSPVNIAMYAIFATHYLSRGILTPLASRYSQNKVSIWSPLVIFLTNTFFHYVNAEFIGSVEYCRAYYYDPRFIIGAVLFLIGFIINRVADTQLIFLRRSSKDMVYVIPKGALFNLISCPNYFAEGMQWLGWCILTWSLAGLVWWLFIESMLIPRARFNHKWYRIQFLAYPSHRKALIPFIF